MTEFDPSKPVMTRGGNRATILTTTRKHRDNIVGLIHRNRGDDVFIFGPDGRVSMDVPSQNDLVNIPESKWMNLYEDPSLLIPYGFSNPWHESRKDADDHAHYLSEHCEAQRVAVTERNASGEFITTAVEK